MSTRSHFMIGLAALLAAMFVALCVWQAPGTIGRKLEPAEVERYVAIVERTAALPAEEKSRFVARLREFGLADDGRPFLMLNLMRYHPQLRTYPGAPALTGTPQETNRRYEDAATPLALARGAYPLVAANATGSDLFGHEASLADWSRTLVMRYPSRRAFLELVTDPRYTPMVPLKLMSLDVVLVPMAAELAIPDIRFAAGAALLAVFLAVGWRRAARHAR